MRPRRDPMKWNLFLDSAIFLRTADFFFSYPLSVCFMSP